MTERAKELFLKYNGNRFHMDREGEGGEYESYHISKETEEMWTEELISSFLTSELHGKEAFRTYSAVTELLKPDRQNPHWDTLLYYPLRTEHLDDVTILYMLRDSYRMAEKAVNKNCFSREEADAYLDELERYTLLMRKRAESGTMTRASDYVMQEFSDPVYIADYLSSLKRKWTGLFC